MKKILTPFFFLIVVNVWSQQLSHKMNFMVNSPSDIVQELVYGYPSDFGPSTIKTVTGDLVKGTNAENDQSGCTPFTNDLTGKIAIIDRGPCNMSLKIYHAQQQGAIGCVIVNSKETEGVTNIIAGDHAGDVVELNLR